MLRMVDELKDEICCKLSQVLRVDRGKGRAKFASRSPIATVNRSTPEKIGGASVEKCRFFRAGRDTGGVLEAEFDCSKMAAVSKFLMEINCKLLDYCDAQAFVIGGCTRVEHHY